MQILRLNDDQETYIDGCASALTAAFARQGLWATHDEALEEVHDILNEGCVFFALEGDEVLGWVGALPEYDGHTWELHPLAVHPDHQGKGVGRALVERLEQAGREAGVWTMMLGTDDEDDRTTLSAVENLYDDLLGHIARLRNRDEANPHPFSFYQRCGYTVVGILPDANGPGKPDIFMAKRLR